MRRDQRQIKRPGPHSAAGAMLEQIAHRPIGARQIGAGGLLQRDRKDGLPRRELQGRGRSLTQRPACHLAQPGRARRGDRIECDTEPIAEPRKTRLPRALRRRDRRGQPQTGVDQPEAVRRTCRAARGIILRHKIGPVIGNVHDRDLSPGTAVPVLVLVSGSLEQHPASEKFNISSKLFCFMDMKIKSRAWPRQAPAAGFAPAPAPLHAWRHGRHRPRLHRYRRGSHKPCGTSSSPCRYRDWRCAVRA